MRYLLLVFLFFLVYQSYSQSPTKILLSGVVMNSDSVVIPDVAIINCRTVKATRTNLNRRFQTEILPEDSLLVYHISYKKRFISLKNNGQHLVLELETHELMQMNINDKKEKEQKYLDNTVSEIKRLAPLKKLEGYDLKSRQQQFIEDHGSHNRGFIPFFGPTIKSPLAKVIAVVSGTEEKRLRKKLTSHYHLVKKKKKKE